MSDYNEINPLRQECTTLLEKAEKFNVRFSPVEYRRVTLGAAGWTLDDMASRFEVKPDTVRKSLRRAELRVSLLKTS